MELDLNDPDCLGVSRVYPVNTEWETDPDALTFRTKLAIFATVMAIFAGLIILAFWWFLAAFIVGLAIGSAFAAGVKLDIRPQWPM